MGMKMISAVAITTVFLGVASAFANPRYNGFQEMDLPPYHGQLRRCHPCMTPPDSGTVEKIEQIMDEERDRMEPVVKKLHTLRRNIRKLAMQKPFNENTVKSKAAELARLEAELLVSQLKTESRIAELLENSKGGEKAP